MPAWAQQGESYGFGNGDTLFYSMSSTSGNCGQQGQLNYTEYIYNNFSYTDPNGVNFPLSAQTEYFDSPGQPYGCPPSGPQPSVLPFTPGGDMDTGEALINFTAGLANNVIVTIQYLGHVAPKYQIESILYAPPGHTSYADYTSTTMVGTTTTFGSSIIQTSTQSVVFGGSASLVVSGFNVLTGSTTGTEDTTYQQEQDSSTTIDISKQNGSGMRVFGPTLDQLGTDSYGYSVLHDSDMMLVWLNPAQQVAVTQSSVAWGRFEFNSADTYATSNMDVPFGPTCFDFLQPDQFHQLDDGQYEHFLRSWDTSGVGGFTTADWQAVAAQDPYCGSANPPIDQTRYQGPINTMTGGYAPPGCPTCNPPSATWNQQYQITNSRGQASITTNTETYIDTWKLSIGKDWWTAQVTNTNSLSWVNKWSSLETSKYTQTSTLSVTGPAASASYTGPTTLNIYQDNIYGTFLFVLSP